MSARSSRKATGGQPGFAERGPGFQGPPRGGQASDTYQKKLLRIGPGGRVVIPADFRRAMEIKEGDVVTAILEDGVLRLISLEVALRRAQALVRKYVPEGVSLADELIEDRRREAEAESRDG